MKNSCIPTAQARALALLLPLLAVAATGCRSSTAIAAVPATGGPSSCTPGTPAQLESVDAGGPASDDEEVSAEQDTAPNETTPISTVPSLGGARVSISLVVVDARGNLGFEDKVRAAAALAEKVLNDSQFQTEVARYAWRGQSGYSQAWRMYPEHRVTSSVEVTSALFGSSAHPGKHVLRWSVESKDNEVGHTEMSPNFDGVTHTDDAWLRGASLPEVANHLIHEHLHRLGFTHRSHRSRERCGSIPYAVGELVCEAAVRLGEGKLDDCDPNPTNKC